MRLSLVAIALIAAALVLGCEKPLPLAPVVGESPGTASPGASVASASFKTDVSPLFVMHCTGCHAPGQNGAGALRLFDASGQPDPAAAKAKLGTIITEVRTGKMPMRRPRLTVDEVSVLQAWQAAGAPDN